MWAEERPRGNLTRSWSGSASRGVRVPSQARPKSRGCLRLMTGVRSDPFFLISAGPRWFLGGLPADARVSEEGWSSAVGWVMCPTGEGSAEAWLALSLPSYHHHLANRHPTPLSFALVPRRPPCTRRNARYTTSPVSQLVLAQPDLPPSLALHALLSSTPLLNLSWRITVQSMVSRSRVSVSRLSSQCWRALVLSRGEGRPGRPGEMGRAPCLETNDLGWPRLELCLAS